MTIHLYIFILLIIFFTSSFSVGLLLFYMNPLANPTLSVTLLSIGLFLSVSSFLAPFIYFFKKIYYRGGVNIFTMHSSVRQAILLSAGMIFFGWMYLYQINDRNILLIAVATILCIEVMFQTLE